MAREELLAEMEKLAAAGDEKAFEEFVLDHFQEFPEEVQSKILFGFFTETLEKQTGETAVAQLQQEGLKTIEEIEKIKARALKERQ